MARNPRQREVSLGLPGGSAGSMPVWWRAYVAVPVALWCFALAFSQSCALEAPESGQTAGEEEFPSFEDFVDRKDDTGYVGSRAAELEATFSGRVRVLVPGRSAEELMALSEAILQNPGAWQHREITNQVTEQVKYARNGLQSEHLNLNLEGGTPVFSAIEASDGVLELTYAVRIESLVKFRDLEEQGLTVGDLIGRTIRLRLPHEPAGLLERIEASCATDPDTGEAVDPSELGAHNLFFYYDPDREGCALSDSELVEATYVVNSSVNAPLVYPEYDRLVEDGRLDMVAIFGQIEHGELSPGDWGFRSFNDLTRRLEERGFERVETFPDELGHRLEQTYPSGLLVSVSLYTPLGFADDVPRQEAAQRFREAMLQHELVYYNGHAFYGSLSALDSPDAYPADVYQVIFMDACWTYAYYTKQIFRNRATEEDPEGYLLVDVVNNTEPAVVGSEQTAAVLWLNLFRGADAVYGGRNASIYSWNNFIIYMNEHAEIRARARRSHPNPEIYGASGVRTNRWQPESTPDTDQDPDPEQQLYVNDTALDIPDNDPEGIYSLIVVPEGAGYLAWVKVQVSIEHTYVGDLTVTLQHGERILNLHHRGGGMDEDLQIDLETEAFSGLEASGQWILRVADHSAFDTGRLVSWSIAF